VRRDAERVYVGKQTGQHRSTQVRINELLVQYARRGLRVARLKGGDPLVFGRGGEELAALSAAGIPAIVVPGVTAALGAAALAGIPLTHRGVSQSVSFVTAMAESTELLNWPALAAPLQTVVFYMGVAQLPRIVEQLRAHGAAADRGAAIVERATLPGQRVIRGTLATIVAQAAAASVRAPALLMVGDVVLQTH
jgi:uroporphyrin-III C-methyltransferase/precorrin-2 dehydrogenase/sirohydrochlorin ferrochelatase